MPMDCKHRANPRVRNAAQVRGKEVGVQNWVLGEGGWGWCQNVLMHSGEISMNIGKGERGGEAGGQELQAQENYGTEEGVD